MQINNEIKLTVKNKYDIYINKNNVNQLYNYFIDKHDNKCLILVDENIRKSFIEEVKRSIDGNNIYEYVIKSGEKSKDIENYKCIISYLINNDFNRNDYIITLGGGVTSDLGGYVASTFKRGCKLIIIPTTTLACVDASVGGKNAINFDGIKNVVGSFYDPVMVIINLAFLKTLDDRNFNSGLIEALKMGLIYDKKLFKLFKNYNRLDDEVLTNIIALSIKDKISIVERDYYDNNLRHILNFGHTLGHAIETTFDDVLHGEAVATGMIPFIENSNILDDVLKIYNKLDIKMIDFKGRIEEIKEKIKNDKKCNKDSIEIIIVNDHVEVVNYTLAELNKKLS